MGRAARTMAALVVTGGVLTGCSEAEPAGQTLPTTSAQAAPTTEALPPLGPADFPMPPEARQKTPEGAVAFTRYYVKLIEYVANSDLNPQPLLDLSSNCEICFRIADAYANDRAAGYSYSDVAIGFTEYGPGLLNGDTAEVGFEYDQSAITVYDRSATVVHERSADATGVLQSGALLTWDNQRMSWLVTGLTIG